MSEIPVNQVSVQDMIAWEKLAKELVRVKAAEMILRKKIFGEAFPNPKKGVNRIDLANGYKLKGEYNIDYKLDEAGFLATKDELLKAGIPVDSVTRIKHELDLRNYNGLTKSQKLLMAAVVTAKPAAPTLTIEAPKDNG